MGEEKKYYTLSGILDFLGFAREFENKKPYPFNRNRENVTFSWGQIIIPKKGIREVVQNKISDIDELPIKEIVMLYQIPFKVDDKRGTDIGVINQNISLGFRYDKAWKYNNETGALSDISVSIPFTDGSYTLTLYNTSTGYQLLTKDITVSGGSVRIDFPAFTNDIAFIIELR